MDRWLTSRAADPDVARRGRWLNILLLSFIVLGSGIVIVNLIFFPPSIAPLIDAAAVLVLAGLYWASRRGAVTAATVSLLAVLTVGILQAGSYGTTGGSEVLVYPGLLALVVITAGIFLSPRWVFLTVVVISAVTVWYYIYSPIPGIVILHNKDPEDVAVAMYTMLILLASAWALSWLSNRLISAGVTELRGRNAELERAYAELAAQTQRERALGHGINDLAAQLAAVSARQVDGVTQQASAIGEVAGAIAELHATADQIGATAGEVSRAADQALSSVQRGQALTVRSREAITRNRTQVQMVIERMNLLDELTRRITRFILSINKLSEETHLLALNATIEAAGAGPLGRRFGVVAAEVQNLSTRSNEIVRQIQGLIGELQRAGMETLTATQGSITVADEVEQLADEVRAAQEQVVEAVQRTTELVHLISAATTQQTTATAQMTDTIAGIAQVADATRVDTGALDAVAATLLQSSDQLMSALNTHTARPATEQ